MRFRKKTIGRVFDLDVDELKRHVKKTYGLRVRGDLKEVGTGFVNVTLAFESSSGRKVARLFGEYDDLTEEEVRVLDYLSSQGFATAKPVKASDGALVAAYGDLHYAVFDFIEGVIPGYSPETFRRIGNAVGEMQNIFAHMPFTLKRENRQLDTYRRRSELVRLLADNDALLKQILTPEDYQTVEPTVRIFGSVGLPKQAPTPVHSDIYNFNLLDDGVRLFVLDFEYVGNGPEIVDAVSYLGWDAISSDRAQKALGMVEKKPEVLVEQMQAYLAGYRSQRELKNAAAAFEVMVFVSVGDSVYNLEKAIKAGENQYRGYTRHLELVSTLYANRGVVEKLLLGKNLL